VTAPFLARPPWFSRSPVVPGASFYGTIEDAWYVPLVVIGFIAAN
jgi:hypothetical protein